MNNLTPTKYKDYYVTPEGELYKVRKVSQMTMKNGDKKAVLYVNNRELNLRIHRIVAETFLDDFDLKADIQHIDGNKANNHYTNLECVARNSPRHRRNQKPTKYKLKLSSEVCAEMIRKMLAGQDMKMLAEAYGIRYSYLLSIARKDRRLDAWALVEGSQTIESTRTERGSE